MLSSEFLEPQLVKDLLPPDDAARALKKTRRTLDRWRAQGKGPPVIFIGRTPYYRTESLVRWIEAQERDPEQPRPSRRRRARPGEQRAAA